MDLVFFKSIESQCCDGILGCLQNIDIASMTQKVKINVKKVANKQRDIQNMIAVFEYKLKASESARK